ncbi:MAG: L,D-transpeptidase family protein [Deltaproteobacteria bacterium]|nr:L,D-transpeptidase family protein [Deltaproteobacteria bacterium]
MMPALPAWLVAFAALADPAGDPPVQAPPAETVCPATTEALPLPPTLSRTDPRLAGPRVVVVRKAARRLLVYESGRLYADGEGSPACWQVALGVDASGVYPPGPKRRRGDRKTPEGWYRTSDKPTSSFYHAIRVHYPNAEDVRAGVAAGLIDAAQARAARAALGAGRVPPQDTRLGGEILLHGGGSSSDWTWGCVALDNADIDALRALLPEGMRTDLLLLP